MRIDSRYVAVGLVLAVAWLAWRGFHREEPAPRPSPGAPTAPAGAVAGPDPGVRPSGTDAKERRPRFAPYSRGDYGPLPELPHGYEGGDTFTSLLSVTGVAPLARILSATTLSVGGEHCIVPAGTTVSLVAKRGTLFIVLLSPPCETSDGPLAQGYLPAGQVRLLPKLSR